MSPRRYGISPRHRQTRASSSSVVASASADSLGVLPCRLELPPAEDVAEVEPSGDCSAPESAALLGRHRLEGRETALEQLERRAVGKQVARPAAGGEAGLRGRTGVFAQPAGVECGEPG